MGHVCARLGSRPGIGLPMIAVIVAVAAGCGSSDGGSTGDRGIVAPSGAQAPSFGAGDPSKATTSTGQAEVCDGRDDDGNGIVDDVDVGADGICDCLRIATLGIPGKWGNGNLFASWLDSRTSESATSLEGAVLTRELLDAFQIVVVEDVSTIARAYSAAEITVLADWVAAGGGLLTLIGYSDASERTNVNALLSSFGLSYAEMPILQKTSALTVPVTQWVTHPTTEGITKVGVDNGYDVVGSGATLATEQGHVVLKAEEFGSGHVLAWGDEWITYDSEWSGRAEYQVERLWVQMLKWLTPASVCQVAVPARLK